MVRSCPSGAVAGEKAAFSGRPQISPLPSWWVTGMTGHPQGLFWRPSPSPSSEPGLQTPQGPSSPPQVSVLKGFSNRNDKSFILSQTHSRGLLAKSPGPALQLHMGVVRGRNTAAVPHAVPCGRAPAVRSACKRRENTPPHMHRYTNIHGSVTRDGPRGTHPKRPPADEKKKGEGTA